MLDSPGTCVVRAEAAFASYVAAGAPAPEIAGSAPVLDFELADPETMQDGGGRRTPEP